MILHNQVKEQVKSESGNIVTCWSQRREKSEIRIKSMQKAHQHQLHKQAKENKTNACKTKRKKAN